VVLMAYDPNKFVYVGGGYRDDWPHLFGQTNIRFNDDSVAVANVPVKEWCTEQFGEESQSVISSIQDGGRWIYLGMGEYGFRNETDATAFRLRWC
jgi:hypothetical protein